MLNIKKNNKGQVLIIVALSLIAFLGFAALVIDVAFFYHTRHQLQGAADAAALAGASVLSCSSDTGTAYQNETSARQAAITFAGNNTAAKLPVALASNNSKNIFDTDNDITVGHWDGANYIEADGTTGFRINAVRVRARRTDDPALGTAMPKVGTFFGKIFGVKDVGIRTEAIADACYIKNFTPIAVNEYWQGECSGGSCGPATCSAVDPNTMPPYGVNHVYPNSFVRPPCDIPGAVNCSSPANGNVFANYTFTTFKSLACDGIKPVTVTPNGPLASDLYSCTPGTGNPGCFGRVTPTSGRVFAIVGGSASNVGNGQMFSLLNLDYRTRSSDPTDTSWYDRTANFKNSPPLSSAQTNPDKNIVARYVAEGTYPYEYPTSIQEVYQPGYMGVSYYTASWPYAVYSFFDGQGVTGQMVDDDFYHGGDYQNFRYKPGDQIVVAVYDGIVNGSGSIQERVALVGFARITICGYGARLRNSANAYPVRCQSPTGGNSPDIQGNPQHTIYGYVASPADALTKNVYDFYQSGFKSILVK